MKMYPKKVKFIANKKDNILYQTGLRKNKIYDTLVDTNEVLEIYEEFGTVTVTNDFGKGHEIEKGDYEIKE